MNLPPIAFPLAVATVVAAIVAAGVLVQGTRYAIWAAWRLTVRIVVAINPEHKLSQWERQVMKGRGFTANKSGGLPGQNPGGVGFK